MPAPPYTKDIQEGSTNVSFVDYIDPIQLARFGLHNGKPADPTLIDGKWESLALAPVNDPAFPHDYFLFTAADNDFLSTQGVALDRKKTGLGGPVFAVKTGLNRLLFSPDLSLQIGPKGIQIGKVLAEK
ncbi:hypothetical protein BDZ97DRAFT_1768020 [Flammula alnicola]|nr:hypothetical protein BDZ97DRAFT_1768020 [Flammula alnicola]